MENTVTKDQWTIQNLTQESYIPIAIDALLVDRKSQNMSKGTICFLRMKLKLFNAFCESLVIKSIDQMNPDVIRHYLFHLQDTGHNWGGIQACYRNLRTFLIQKLTPGESRAS